MFFQKTAMILGRYGTIGQRSYKTFPQYKDLMKRFNDTYPDIRKHLISKVNDENVKEEFGKAMDYQLIAGRQTRAIITLKVHEVMTSAVSSNENSEGLQPVHVMAWINELVQGSTLVLDDMVDRSNLRRGKVPWHIGREEEAIHHLIMLILAPNYLMNDWFHKNEFFLSASNLLLQHRFDGPVHQLLDGRKLDWIKNKNIPWEEYTRQLILRANYSIDLPFKIGAFVATNKDLKFTPLIDEILADIAMLMQLHNESFNLLPKYKHVNFGKDLDEDIKVEKVDFAMTYLMNNANEDDKDLIVSMVGKDDQNCVKKVREIYEKYEIADELEKYLRNLKKSIGEKIEKVSNDYKLRDALHATKEILEVYPESDPRKKFC